MVAQGHLINAQLLEGGVHGPPAHFRAHGAGVLFPPQVEDDVENLRLNEVVGHVQLPAQPLHRGKVHPGRAGVDGDGVELKGRGVELPQLRHGVQQHQGVLAAGHPHGDLVPGVDHVVVLHAPAQVGQDMLHCRFPLLNSMVREGPAPPPARMSAVSLLKNQNEHTEASDRLTMKKRVFEKYLKKYRYFG